MKVIAVMSSKDAKHLEKKKELDTTEIMAMYNKEAVGVIGQYLFDQTGYDNSPIVGICRIEKNNVSIEKNFQQIQNYLPISVGDYMIETAVNDDEVITIGYDDFNSFEMLMDDESVEYAEKLEAIDNVKKLLHVGHQTDIAFEICFIPSIRLKDCNSFAVLSEDWGQSHAKLGGLKPANLNALEVFSK